MLVGDNEPVKAGQVLARIDDRDFKVAVEQARADVEPTRLHRQQASRSRRASGSIDAARATIVADEAKQAFAGQEDKRYADLAKTGFGTVQNAQQASSRVNAARRRSRAIPPPSPTRPSRSTC